MLYIFFHALLINKLNNDLKNKNKLFIILQVFMIQLHYYQNTFVYFKLQSLILKSEY